MAGQFTIIHLLLLITNSFAAMHQNRISVGGQSATNANQTSLLQLFNSAPPTTLSALKSGDFGGIVPHHYAINLDLPKRRAELPFHQNMAFSGSMRLHFSVRRQIRSIFVHVKRLLFINRDNARVLYDDTHAKGKIGVLQTVHHHERELLEVQLERPLSPTHSYVIEITNYTGRINGRKEMGLFSGVVHQATTRRLFTVVSQFQMSEARTVFPCVDLPQFKTTFTLTLQFPPDFIGLSNTPIYSTRITERGWNETQFKTTTLLPTYTVGLCLIPNVYRTLSGRTDGLRFQLRYNPYAISDAKARTLMDYTEYSLRFIQQRFQQRLPLKKLDLVIVPDFLVQGMENFGLITLREDYLQKRWPSYSLSLIAHEIVHMWLSNLVTVRSWRGICIQESLTDHYARTVVKHYFRQDTFEWQRYIVDKYHFSMSQRSASDPAITPILGNEPRLREVSRACFGRPVFLIGSAQQLIGEARFDQIIRGFIRQYRDKHYTVEQFESVFDAVTLDGRHKLGDVLGHWFKHGGYPSLTVHRDYASKSAKIVQQQVVDKYLGSPPLILNEVWPIGFGPITTGSEVTTWKVPTKKLITTTETLVDSTGLRDSQSLILNENFTFFHRVNYDLHNWNLIAQDMRHRPHRFNPLTVAQLVGDFCFFNSLGLIPNGSRVRKTLFDASKALLAGSPPGISLRPSNCHEPRRLPA